MAKTLTHIIISCIVMFLLVLTVCLVEVRWSPAEHTLAFSLPLLLLGAVAIALCNRSTIRFTIGDLLILLWGVYYFGRIWMGAEYPCATTALQSMMMILLYIVLRILFSCATDCGLLSTVLVVGILLCGGMEAISGLSQLFMHSSRHAQFLLTGSFLNPGPYSAYLAVAIAIGMAWNPHTDWGNLLRKVLLAVMLVALSLTWSRAAFVAIGIVGLWHFRKEYWKIRYPLWGTVFVVGIVLYLLKQDSADGRLLVWQSALHSWCCSPVWGVGIGGFPKAYSDGMESLYHATADINQLMSADVVEYAFNDLLKVLVEQGIVGLLLALTTIGVLLYHLYRCSRPLFLGMTALLLFSLFSYPMEQFPYRILVVLVAAYAESTVAHAQKSSTTHRWLPLCALLLVPLAWGVYRQVGKRVDMDKEYKMFSHMNDQVFIQDFYDLLPYGQDDPAYLFRFGKLLQAHGRYTDSNAMLRRGTAISSDPMFYVLVGNNYTAQGYYEEAEAAYWEAYRRMPNRLYPLYQLMTLYHTMGDRERTKEMAHRVLEKREKVASPATKEMKERAKKLLKLLEYEI